MSRGLEIEPKYIQNGKKGAGMFIIPEEIGLRLQ
jgi:hypothetical protein